ncbi:glutathione S-transferase [Penicillium samsonianum]|uniref:glutathione S-transferase n=1 Tax=Penicillium samsonianum TaxID=1882272 RepID=UPI0025488096|nr:glutathione S-transferase [Penicillium samsonianum]KAJ6119092.1 glutathione S-transferase [Penicillium samsonianum]
MSFVNMKGNTAENEFIDLYIQANSSNGLEIIVLLEELGVQYCIYRVHHIEEIEEERLRFMDIHSHLPILTDVHPDGQRFRIQETGAIAQYLIAHYDASRTLSYPPLSAEDIEVNNWLFFLTSRLGPNHEEAVHFFEAPEKIPYGTSHFVDKTMQLYLILERHLQKSGTLYMVNNKCTVADIVHVPYVAGAKSAGIAIEQFPALECWYGRMARRPAIAKGFGMLKQHESGHSNGARPLESSRTE